MPTSQPIDIPDAKKRGKKKKRCRATDSFSGRFEGECGSRHWVLGSWHQPIVLTRSPPLPRRLPAARGCARGRGPCPRADLRQPHHQPGVCGQGELLSTPTPGWPGPGWRSSSSPQPRESQCLNMAWGRQCRPPWESGSALISRGEVTVRAGPCLPPAQVPRACCWSCHHELEALVRGQVACCILTPSP